MKVAIIGSGPAGSYAAYLAKKQGHTVEVCEKSAEIGGRTLSHRQDGFTHDTGAAFITNFYNRVSVFFGINKRLYFSSKTSKSYQPDEYVPPFALGSLQ